MDAYFYSNHTDHQKHFALNTWRKLVRKPPQLCKDFDPWYEEKAMKSNASGAWYVNKWNREAEKSSGGGGMWRVSASCQRLPCPQPYPIPAGSEWECGSVSQELLTLQEKLESLFLYNNLLIFNVEVNQKFFNSCVGQHSAGQTKYSNQRLDLAGTTHSVLWFWVPWE